MDLVFHDLRHDALSRWAERGMSLPDLQAIGGHRDLRSLRRYLHSQAAAVAKRMEVWSDLAVEAEPAS